MYLRTALIIHEKQLLASDFYGVMRVYEEFEAPTELQAAFVKRETLEAGGVYLVTLHDLSGVKIRIDRISNSSVHFTYAVGVMIPEEKEAAPKNVILHLNSGYVMVEGYFFQLDPAHAPRTVDGQTMISLPFIADALGAELNWNSNEQKITLHLNGATVELGIDSKEAAVNGEKTSMDVPPQKIGDLVFVPLLFISEKLAQKVALDSNNAIVTINGPEEASPEEEPAPPAVSISEFMGTFLLFIPGGAYSYDDYSTNTRTNTVFHGASNGTLTIHEDGTFEFNKSTNNWNRLTSKYDAGTGTWSETGNSDYPILLSDSQSGKQFKIGKSLRLGGDIVVWEVGGTSEVGTRQYNRTYQALLPISKQKKYGL